MLPILLLSMLVLGPWKDPEGIQLPADADVLRPAVLPMLIAGTRMHLGVLVAVLVALAAWLVMSRSILGFEIRVVRLGAERRRAMPASAAQRMVWLTHAGRAAASPGSPAMFEVAGPIGQLIPKLTAGLRLHRDHRRLPRPAAIRSASSSPAS